MTRKTIILTAALALFAGAAHAQGASCNDCETQYRERSVKCEIGLTDEARTICTSNAHSNYKACKSDCAVQTGQP